MSETNKANTVAFHKQAVFQGDVENAFRLYGGAPYCQHNPLIGDGMEGLRRFVALLKANRPNAHGEIKRVFADGDYVILHSQWHGLSTVRAAKPSLTFTGRKTARWSSTGMSFSRSRRRLRTTIRCSDPLTTAVAAIIVFNPAVKFRLSSFGQHPAAAVSLSRLKGKN
jgi:predicted SnoaL-like aldol condensation-catalyzing enzyme